MLRRIHELLAEQQSFAFETTLSTLNYQSTVLEAKEKSYTVTLLFFWLKNVELAKKRVSIRVAEGGHNIESDIIERRYYREINNLFDIYLPIVDGALIFDNSQGNHELLALQTIDSHLSVFNERKFNDLKNYHDHR